MHTSQCHKVEHISEGWRECVKSAVFRYRTEIQEECETIIDQHSNCTVTFIDVPIEVCDPKQEQRYRLILQIYSSHLLISDVKSSWIW